ncbi:MAG: Flp pilus assembly complex ATPase component TadA [Nitrospirae bacterium]|nr:Flp pilus assembly complex ATPase component TadA [Nitrospirota bacterium]
MPLIREKLLSLSDILSQAVNAGASDIHLSPGKPILFRVDGKLEVLKESRIVEKEDIQYFLEDYLNKREKERYEERKSYDVSVQMQNSDVASRARLHFYESMDGICLSCRIVPLTPREMGELLIPPVVKGWINERGIVIVSGLANMGKTTTLASIVNFINTSKPEKIVILEDPVEYVHEDIKSRIFQREIGQHSPSYADALRDIAREDTDTVVVGEVRNAQTMDAVFGMAENGLKVYISIHAKGAIETLEKIVSLFQPSDYERVYKRLAWTLIGILNQWLVPRKKCGRVLACEILTAKTVLNALREGKIHQIASYLEPGDGYGMCTLEKYQDQLRSKGLL